MASLLYIVQPKPTNPPAGTDPNALAWFGQFASGHLRHVDQCLAVWATDNGIPTKPTVMAWAEYERLLAEAHWYEG